MAWPAAVCLRWHYSLFVFCYYRASGGTELDASGPGLWRCLTKLEVLRTSFPDEGNRAPCLRSALFIRTWPGQVGYVERQCLLHCRELMNSFIPSEKKLARGCVASSAVSAKSRRYFKYFTRFGWSPAHRVVVFLFRSGRSTITCLGRRRAWPRDCPPRHSRNTEDDSLSRLAQCHIGRPTCHSLLLASLASSFPRVVVA